MPKICKLDYCDRPHYARGYCNPHWQQDRKGEALRPLSRAPRDGRECEYPGCGRPLGYARHCQSHGRMLAEGKPLRPIRAKADYAGTPCRISWCNRRPKVYSLCAGHQRFSRFDVDDETLSRLAAQKVCELCGRPPGSRALHVDHDHSCCPSQLGCSKCIRGMLCQSCNNGLGFFMDNPTLLRQAATYLEEQNDPAASSARDSGRVGVSVEG